MSVVDFEMNQSCRCLWTYVLSSVWQVFALEKSSLRNNMHHRTDLREKKRGRVYLCSLSTVLPSMLQHSLFSNHHSPSFRWLTLYHLYLCIMFPTLICIWKLLSLSFLSLVYSSTFRRSFKFYFQAKKFYLLKDIKFNIFANNYFRIWEKII